MKTMRSPRSRHRAATITIILVTIAVVSGMAGCGTTNGTGPDTHPFAGGSGTAADPYQITNWTQLDAVRNYLRSHFILMNDLDSSTAGYAELASAAANDGMGWKPIGLTSASATVFQASLDGQGYEIRDLFINRPQGLAWVGLFTILAESGTITYVGLVDADVTGGRWVGGLVAENKGVVSDCYSTGSVTGTDYVGGLVGWNYKGTVSDCYASGAVAGDERVGGLVGTNRGTVNSSYATGNVEGGSHVGGLVGGNDGGTVENSYAEGSVTGDNYVGGLVGTNRGAVNSSYATGNVEGGSHVGGLVGGNDGGTVENSYAEGSVTGDNYVGGLAGGNYEGTVTDCYASGAVAGPERVGGLLGLNSGTVNNSFYNYDQVLINGENVITFGALFSEDFEEWLANGKLLHVADRLSNEDGFYVLNNVSDFKQLLAFGQDSSLKFRLKNDLDLATEPNLYIPYLAGEFDGNGHKIANLSFSFDFVSPVGLFGHLAPGGEVRELGVENVNVVGRSGVGGLVGLNQGTVSNSYSTGSVAGDNYAGGLVGSNSGTVSDCYASGAVAGDNMVGGLVGWNYKGTVSDCYASGAVAGDERVGGLVGHNWGTVSDCYASGSVIGYGGGGGLVGSNSGTVSNSYSTGSVAGDNMVGGLVGWNLGTVSDCYASGTVSGRRHVGGLMGFNERTVNNSFYNYDQVLINGENVITFGALFSEDFEEWLANGKLLHVADRLSNEDGFYVLNNASDFKQLLAFGQDSSLRFRLKSDLDLATEPNLYIPYLAGEFDGNGHKIENLSFSFDFVSPVGLFGHLAPGGEVRELGVENVNVVGRSGVGGLVGLNQGTVSHSYAGGTVTGRSRAGGMVGINDGDISESHSTGTIAGSFEIGGLVGVSARRISNCHSTANASGEEYVGGLVGHNWGFGRRPTVRACYATGTVSGRLSVGGLLGSNSGDVSNSYATGSVMGESYVGGLVGYNLRTVSNSYAGGNVTGDLDVGGLVGYNSGTVSNSFWDVQASGQTASAGGTGKGTQEMKSLVTFADTETEGLEEPWDIIAITDPDTRNSAYIWNIVDGETYPFLSWQSVP